MRCPYTPRPTTTMRSAGRTPRTLRSSGPSRWPPIGVARQRNHRASAERRRIERADPRPEAVAQEQAPLGHRRDRGSRGWRRRCDRRPRPHHRWLGPVPPHGGRATYCYDFLGIEHYFVRGDSPLEPGTHQVRMEFDYDGGGVGKGATVTLYVDGSEVGSGRVEQSEGHMFCAEETCDVCVVDVTRLHPGDEPVHRHRQLGRARDRRGRFRR